MSLVKKNNQHKIFNLPIIFLFFCLFYLCSCNNFGSIGNFTFKNSAKNTAKTINSQSQTKTPTPTTQTAKHLETYNLNNIGNNLPEKIKVAIFLPFSGKNKDLAQNIANSAVISLFENDRFHKLELVFIDSKEDPTEQKQAFQEVINRNIKLVIGPIYSNNIANIEALAKEYAITVISFSNNINMLGKIFDNGGGIFVAGILPETQIEQIVNYTIGQNKQNFAILAPNNQYGKLICEYLKKFTKVRNANFITAEFYNNEKDLEKSAEKLVNAFSLSITPKKDQIINEEDKNYPQAILIPEAGKILSKAVATINNKNNKELDLKIIGTNQWDDSLTLQDSNLFGSWFVAPEPKKFQDFAKKYQQTFKNLPARLSSIAYDSILAFSEISANQNEITAHHLIAKQKGFNGIDGLFRFLPNGAVQRNLAILQVGINNFDIVEPASTKFLNY
jgi:ABC-type branched-subunit amino acid transport system substrate-binding protein